jgi:hypothetical protein
LQRPRIAAARALFAAVFGGGAAASRPARRERASRARDDALPPTPRFPSQHQPQTPHPTGDDDKGDRVTLSREEEPDEYWVSAGEKKGANPMKDPLAIIGILAIFFPFGLLLIAGATGLVDFSVYR